MVETVVCLHKSIVTMKSDGEHEICGICRQERLLNHNKSPEVLKRGYINGIITDITPLMSKAPLQQVEDSIEEIIEEPVEPIKESPLTSRPISAKGRQSAKAVRELRKFYEVNKEKVIADYYKLASRVFLEKWKLSTSYWLKLKGDWEVRAKAEITNLKREKKASSRRDTNIQVQGLPQFPAFSHLWHPSVQIEWIRTYQEMAKGMAK